MVGTSVAAAAKLDTSEFVRWVSHFITHTCTHTYIHTHTSVYCTVSAREKNINKKYEMQRSVSRVTVVCVVCVA